MDDKSNIKCAAIVVVAFNRSTALSRLLSTIAKADYDGFKDIPLVISIDHGGSCEVGSIAERFNWEYGSKRIINHPKNLGLREHVLFCGDLSLEYGAVIILEDDLSVSPYFYHYVDSSISFFSKHEQVCQISLYSPQMNEFARRPFIPVADSYDNYFIQSASSWGQVWTAEHWQLFRQWYYQCIKDDNAEWDGIPYMIKEWPASSWKKYFIKYMRDCNMYAVYPRVSLTTNWGDDGMHMKSVGSRFQVPLLLMDKKYNFVSIEKSLAVYDSFFEPNEETLKGLAPCLVDYQTIEADFYGTKRPSDIRAEFLISIKCCDQPVLSFGGIMLPPIINIVFEVPGQYFYLGKATDFKKIPFYLRLKIFIEMAAWVGLPVLMHGAKRRIKKYLNMRL